MAAVESAAVVILRCGFFGRTQARIGKELVGAFFIGIGDQSAVELLGHIDSRFAFARMQDGKRVAAQGPVRRAQGNYGRLAGCEKLLSGREALRGAFHARSDCRRGLGSRSRLVVRSSLLARGYAQVLDKCLHACAGGKFSKPNL